MGRCHRRYIPAVQIVKDGDGKRRPLCGVGPRPQLVKEGQCLFVGTFEDIDSIYHMRGKGAEALLDTLFISDIGVDLLVHPQVGMVICRNVHARLPHQCKKSHCF